MSKSIYTKLEVGDHPVIPMEWPSGTFVYQALKNPGCRSVTFADGAKYTKITKREHDLLEPFDGSTLFEQEYPQL